MAGGYDMWFNPSLARWTGWVGKLLSGKTYIITDNFEWEWLKVTDIYPVEAKGYMNAFLDASFIAFAALAFLAPIAMLAAPAIIVLLVTYFVCLGIQMLYLYPVTYPAKYFFGKFWQSSVYTVLAFLVYGERYGEHTLLHFFDP